MANEFSQEERVAFEDVMTGFEDALVLSSNVSIHQSDAQNMENSNNTEWLPMPYIAQSYNGTDMTANFKDKTQLAIPAQINIEKSSPWVMTANELNVALREKSLGKAAQKKLASDINVSVSTVASNQGTLVIKRTSAASGFADIAEAEAVMNEQGIPAHDRFMALSTRDYNGLSADLGGRETLKGKALTAYEKAYVGLISNFETFKLDYATNRAAKAASSVTVNGASQYHTPLASRTAAGTGETSNVDNRYQNLAVTVGSGTIAVGDCFTIAGVYSVHQETKQATTQLKTFRVTSLLASAGATGTIQISPPIISNGGGTAAEGDYQNVSATPADGAAITFLNTVAGPANPFWFKDSIKLLPGHFVIPSDAGAAVMRGTTDNGIEVTMMKQFDIKTRKTFFRLDVFYGVVMANPEMAGIILFSQT